MNLTLEGYAVSRLQQLEIQTENQDKTIKAGQREIERLRRNLEEVKGLIHFEQNSKKEYWMVDGIYNEKRVKALAEALGVNLEEEEGDQKCSLTE